MKSSSPASGHLMYPALVLAAALSAGALIAVSVDFGQAGRWQVPFFLTAGSCAYLIWTRVQVPDGLSRVLSFGMAILLACGVNRAIYATDYLVNGSSFADWPLPSMSPARDLFMAEVITLTGTFLTFFVWLAAGGARLSSDCVGEVRRSRSVQRRFLCLYGLSLLATLLLMARSDAASSLGAAVPAVNALGVGALFFLIRQMSWSGLRKVVVHLALSIPYLLLAIQSTGKEAMIIALLPVALTAWFALPRTSARISLAIAGLVVIAVVSNLSTYMRVMTWGVDKRTASVSELVTEFLTVSDQLGHAETGRVGVSSFLSRANASGYRGYAVTLAETEGRHPELVYGPLAYVFIPRVLWPDKPSIDPGKEYTSLVFGRYVDSSMSAGFYTSFYLGAGWFGVLSGAVVLGLLIVALSRAAVRLGGQAFLALFSFVLLPVAVRIDEGWGAATLAGLLLTFMYSCAAWVAATLLAQTGAALMSSSRDRRVGRPTAGIGPA